jgi:hypothetical protein
LLLADGLLELDDLHVDSLLFVAGLLLVVLFLQVEVLLVVDLLVSVLPVVGLHVVVLLTVGLQVVVLLTAGFSLVEVLQLLAVFVLVAGLHVDFLVSVVGLLVVEDLSQVSVFGLQFDDLQDPSFELPVLELPVLELPILELPVLELPVFELPVFELPVLEDPVLVVSDVTWSELTGYTEICVILLVSPIRSVGEMPRLFKSIEFELLYASANLAR